MDSVTQNSQKSKRGLIAAIVALLLIAGGVFAFWKTDKNANTNEPLNTQNPTSSNPAILNSRYKDGTYTVDGNYQSPGGSEVIGVTLVLKDDVVVDATATVKTTRPISIDLQKAFIAGFKSQVVGKNIDQVNVGKVSGSSLTPKGFNDAVSKIKAQAAVAA